MESDSLSSSIQSSNVVDQKVLPAEIKNENIEVSHVKMEFLVLDSVEMSENRVDDESEQKEEVETDTFINSMKISILQEEKERARFSAVGELPLVDHSIEIPMNRVESEFADVTADELQQNADNETSEPTDSPNLQEDSEQATVASAEEPEHISDADDKNNKLDKTNTKKRKRPKKLPETLSCRLCRKVFLRKHMNRHALFHLSKDKKIDRYRCSYCGFSSHDLQRVKKNHNHGNSENYCEDLIDECREEASEMSMACFGLKMFDTARNNIIFPLKPAKSKSMDDSEKSKKRKLDPDSSLLCSKCGSGLVRKLKRSSLVDGKDSAIAEKYICHYCGHENKHGLPKDNESGLVMPQNERKVEDPEVLENRLVEDNVKRFVIPKQEEFDDSIIMLNYNDTRFTNHVKQEVEEEEGIFTARSESFTTNNTNTRADSSLTINDDFDEFLKRHRVLNSWNFEEVASHVQSVAKRIGYPETETNEISKVLIENRISGLALSFEDNSLTNFFERCGVVYGLQSAILHVLSLMKFTELKKGSGLFYF